MTSNNSKHTVHAAQGRQERDSAATDCKTPEDRQSMVSMGLYEGRPFPGTADRDQ